LRVRGIRSSVVADGRWFVHRLGAAGVRLHRAGRLDRESVLGAGLFGDRGVVRERRRRRVRRAAWLPQVAWNALRIQWAGPSICFHPSSPVFLEFSTEYTTPSGPTTNPLCTS